MDRQVRMTRFAVRTLTLNPSIDLSSETDKVQPTHKVRTTREQMDPGGGGINVARVLHRFGAAVEAIFLGGGPTGAVLDTLIERQGFARHMVPIGDDTRISLSVFERSSGCEYRFVPEGPAVTHDELDACIAAAANGTSDYFVASGSLPACVRDDFYAALFERLRAGGTRLLLDTSGAELRRTLQAGGLFLVKPSRGELEQLAGRPLTGRGDLIAEARRIVAAGQSEHVAVTLGRDGAMLISRNGAWSLPAVPVETRSAVGAGDSFLAAMTWGFVTGLSALEAFRLGSAAGAATALTAGTDLCHMDDVQRLLGQVPEPQPLD